MEQMDIKPDAQGKVRNIYDLGDSLLFVATDRISAFDYILPDEIPDKGRVLTQISLFWYDMMSDIVPIDLISADVADLPEKFKPYESYLDGRFMLVKKADMYPIECIVRGYLTGSGLKSYEADGTVAGVKLPAGLQNGSKLPHTMFTPSTKAPEGEHDQNITFAECEKIVGVDIAAQLRDNTVKIYEKAEAYAREKGIIVCDTKFEFGNVDGKVTLCDEVLTPDSSRFWDMATYKEGQENPSYDKQYVRDWLNAHWDRDKDPNPPHLPEDVIARTREIYIKAYESLSGKSFAWK